MGLEKEAMLAETSAAGVEDACIAEEAAGVKATGVEVLYSVSVKVLVT